MGGGSTNQPTNEKPTEIFHIEHSRLGSPDDLKYLIDKLHEALAASVGHRFGPFRFPPFFLF